jgi:hypothetical protein
VGEVKMYFFGLHFFARMALSPQDDSRIQGGVARENIYV